MRGRLTEKDEQGNWALRGVKWEQLHKGAVITDEIYEKLYGALWKLMEYEDAGLSPGEVDLIKQMYDDVVDRHRWRDVREELPQEGELVFVTCQAQKWEPDVKSAYHVGGNWFGPRILPGVTAWMPLPESYRPDGD